MNKTPLYDWISLGGGAAGYFGAIQFAEHQKQHGLSPRVLILEASRRTLSKVKISGGGRCNVTHACFDSRQLAQNYPRGSKELLSVFSRFQARDTIDWFQTRGVSLKTETDGRMFPTTDDSKTIIHCFEQARKELGISLQLNSAAESIESFDEGMMTIKTKDGLFRTRNLLMATGSNKTSFELLKTIGHKIISPVASLFSFNIEDPRLEDLSGRSFKKVGISAKINGKRLTSVGPMLITHWGLSGPSILKFSSMFARDLASIDYRFSIRINFLPELNCEEIESFVFKTAEQACSKQLKNFSIKAFPQKYWESLIEYLGFGLQTKWSDLSKKQIRKLAQEVGAAEFEISGKTTNKEEFVTAGGVNLKEVDFRFMQSRKAPGLFFAGEVLDIDGITGGFNFQSAWSTSYIAAQAASQQITSSQITSSQITSSIEKQSHAS